MELLRINIDGRTYRVIRSVWHALLAKAAEDKATADKAVLDPALETKTCGYMVRVYHEQAKQTIREIALRHYQYLELRAKGIVKVWGVEQPLDKPMRDEWLKLGGDQSRQMHSHDWIEGVMVVRSYMGWTISMVRREGEVPYLRVDHEEKGIHTHLLVNPQSAPYFVWKHTQGLPKRIVAWAEQGAKLIKTAALSRK